MFTPSLLPIPLDFRGPGLTGTKPQQSANTVQSGQVTGVLTKLFYQQMQSPAPALGATRHSLTQQCFLQLAVLVSQERNPTGIRLGTQQHYSGLTCQKVEGNSITYAGMETELGRDPEMTPPWEHL